jgi:parallel beta-helix repeat protein
MIDNNLVYGNSEPGIVMVDTGSITDVANIQNNDVYSNNQAGISVAGATYLNIADNTIRNNGQSGVGFNRADIQVIYGKPVGVSSQPVTVTQNDIYGNGQGGIGVLDRITGPVTISLNNIHANLGGVGVQNGCTLEITRNSIYNNLRGGVHSGTDLLDGGGFAGALGSAQLTVRQNKIYGNGLSEFGAGIDVRHASGVIHNNIVYRNLMGGIRFGAYIAEIKNNTVANNGQSETGGGISYDDLEGEVGDPPSGTLKDSPNLPDPVIRNNISAFNVNAGLRVGVGSLPEDDDETDGSAQRAATRDEDSGQSCFVATAMAADEPVLEPSEDCPTNQSLGGGYYWDYNLLYCNNETCDGSPEERGYPDNCGWPPPYELGEEVCVTMNYAACPPLGLTNHHHIIEDPMFVDMDADDYRLQAGSPAKGAGDDGTDMGAYGGSTPIDW